MSFLSDLVHGNVSNLGNDLSPSNFFSDTASSASNFFSNPINDIALGAAVALPFLAPEILPAAAATDVAGAAGAGLGGFDLSTIGPGLAAGGTDLSGLTAGDVSFLGPDVLGEASAPGAFAGTGTALTMGGGGTIDPAVAAATGPIAPTAAAPAAAAPSFAQDLTSSELLAGTGVGGGSPVGTFGAAPGAAASGGNVLTDTLSGVGNFLGSPAGKGATALAGIGGLGYNLYEGYQQKKQLNAMNQLEQQTVQQAQQAQAAAQKQVTPLLNNGTMLTSFLTNNTLPPQFQSQIDQWVQATKAGITQGYASRGQSADPKQNSALQQDLANVDQQALGLKANFEEILSTAGQQMIQTANQLLTTGLSATQLESKIPLAVSRLNITLNQEMSSAISNFAAALNGGNRNTGGPGTLTLNLNPQTGAIGQ